MNKKNKNHKNMKTYEQIYKLVHIFIKRMSTLTQHFYIK